MMEELVKKYGLKLEHNDGIWFSFNRGEKINYPSQGYDYNFYIEEHSFWFKHRNDCIREIVTRFIKDKGYFWDVGGGNGYVSRMLQNIGFKSILVEPDLRGCQNARKRNVNMVVCSRVEDMGLPDHGIKAVGLFDVIEHLEQDEKFLTMLSNLVSRYGYIFITVPAHEYLWSDLDIVSEHVRRYSLEKLVKTLENSGFKTVYHTYFFRFFSIPIFLLRCIPYRLSGRRVKSFELAASQAMKEHSTGNSFIRNMLTRYLERESKVLRHSRINHGSSLMVVAVPS